MRRNLARVALASAGLVATWVAIAVVTVTQGPDWLYPGVAALGFAIALVVLPAGFIAIHVDHKLARWDRPTKGEFALGAVLVWALWASVGFALLVSLAYLWLYPALAVALGVYAARHPERPRAARPMVGVMLALLASAVVSGDRSVRDRAATTHLLPDGFTGPVVIVFGIFDGSPSHEGFQRLYRIPPGGVLLTQLPPPAGLERERFFSVDPSAGRTEVLRRSPDDTKHAGAARRTEELLIHKNRLASDPIERGGEVCRLRFSHQSYVVGRESDRSIGPDPSVLLEAFVSDPANPAGLCQ